MLSEAAQTSTGRSCRAAGKWWRRPIRHVAGLTAAVSLVAAPMSLAAAADRIAAEVSAETSSGFGRIVYQFNGDLDANARLSNSILIVSFSAPVEVSVDRMNTIAAGYVSAARRDPDGKGVRIALAQRVTMHAIQVNERLYIDLMPETWKGPPPPLPQPVIEELARRAREAERRQRQMEQLAKQKPLAMTRVRVAHQPSFSRYIFELPDIVDVVTERNGEKFSLKLDAPLKFDLGEAKASLPSMIEHLDAETGETATNVKFSFVGKVDVRTFRDDDTYVVDVASVVAPFRRSDPLRLEPSAEAAATPAVPSGLEVPPTVPVRPRKPAETPADASDERPADQMAAPPPEAPRGGAPRTMADSPRPMTTTNPLAPPQPPQNAPRGGSLPAEPPASGPAERSAVKPPAPHPEPASRPENPADRGTAPADTVGSVAVQLHRQGDNLKLQFPFPAKTSGAVFRRADTIWAVFDTAAPIDVTALRSDPSRTLAAVTVEGGPKVQIVRMKLNRPRLTSFSADDDDWTIAIGDTVLDPTLPIAITRNPVGSKHVTAVAPFEDPQAVHHLADPDVGDSLVVATGFAPARGVLKQQDFVEFRVLPSTHGIVVQPLADDVDVDTAGDKIVISRPTGLTLSAANQIARRSGYRPVVFDPQAWGFDREADFNERQRELITASAGALDSKRLPKRFDLARFYLARAMYPEAKGVLDVALADDHPTAEDSSGLVMRAITDIMMDRPDEALRDLSNPLVGNNYDAPLWRAMAYARQGKWAEAAEHFRKAESAISTLPVEMQRQVFLTAARTAIETRDYATASDRLSEFETLGVPKELEPSIAVLTGRLAEGLGRDEDALTSYRAAADSTDRVAAARGHLNDIQLRFRRDELKPAEVIDELEALTTLWRGDDTEIEGLQTLAHLYTEAGRYRDAFNVARTALKSHPNSEMTRRIQEESAATFDALFLAGKGDVLPAIDALALFYDFRELTPIGRRGDEMIRRLTDRLVSVDLLDQAAELLQHQVDHRLQGAARAQVASRLAVIYLMNRKPDKALAALASTRTAEVSNELRNQRLLVESRALSDIGRHDVAIDIIANLTGREAMRMRADAHWAAKRWREGSEQIELLYGDRWKSFEPLNDAERADLLRAAVGYAIGDDPIGLQRFREKFAAKMADSPDSRAFEVATTPLAQSGNEFGDVVRQIASVDTLDGFLRELRNRYPETGSFGPVPPATPAPPAASAPRASAPLADVNPTGSIGAWRLRSAMQ